METKISKEKLIIICSVIASIILVILLALLFFNKRDKQITMYEVTFNSDGGTKIESQFIEKGKTAKKPIDPEMEGYSFIDWAYNDVTYDFKKKVTKDITLVARWYKMDKDTESFTIKFNSDGGTTISNQIIEKGKSIFKPTDPIKSGYIFKGWLLNGKSFDFSSIIENDIELVAAWEKEITTTTAKKEEKTTKKTTTVKNNTTSVKQTTTTTVKQTTTTAKKTTTTTRPKQNYTVTFNSNGGTGVNSQTVLEGNRVVQPGNPTKEGYKFIAWTLNGSNYNFGNSVNSNISLVAKWAQKSYTIKISAVDDYSPARVLTVYEDGVRITPKEIRYTNGTYLCSGANANVNKNVVSGQTSFIVVLSGGTRVTATVN